MLLSNILDSYADIESSLNKRAFVQHWTLTPQINEEEVRRGVILRRPKGKAPRPPRPKSEVFLDQAAKRRSKRYSAFGVSQSNATVYDISACPTVELFSHNLDRIVR